MSDEGLGVACPLPGASGEPAIVTLAHGGGGRKTRELVERVFVAAFGSRAAEARHDAAVLTLGGARVAFTTDGYVVRPRFFPGGDLGALSVFGTVNDLAVAGAVPRALSVALVLEEGVALSELEALAASMRRAADQAGVELATGDTKVVERGKGDGVFVVTSGVGELRQGARVGPREVRPGDVVLVSGDVGRHGLAVVSAREGLSFEPPIESDCGSVAGLVAALYDAGLSPRFLRDPTRGGLATVLAELALDGGEGGRGVGVSLDERAVPVSPEVQAACEVLGFDPLYVACEGRLVVVVPEHEHERALATLTATPGGEGAARIGVLTHERPGLVVGHTGLGSTRVLDLLSGEQLPRIC